MQQPFRAGGTPPEKAFTQNWLQSLTLVAQNPIARQVKPLLDTVNDLTRFNSEADRLTSAQKLWDFASAEGLRGLLEILPIQQPVWRFGDDEMFNYLHAKQELVPDFAAWSKCLGLTVGEFALLAEVTSSDWLTLLRQEAVRLQRPTNVAAMPQGTNLTLPCTARWNLDSWSVSFDQADWVSVQYDDAFTVSRVSFADISEKVLWMITEAQDICIPKTVPKCTVDVADHAWMACAERLAALHQRILVQEANYFSPWFRRTWACIWPIIYREQNVLRGQAQLDPLRQEIAACIAAVPRLVLRMFTMAKLLCEILFGRGLGISAHYVA